MYTYKSEKDLFATRFVCMFPLFDKKKDLLATGEEHVFRMYHSLLLRGKPRHLKMEKKYGKKKIKNPHHTRTFTTSQA